PSPVNPCHNDSKLQNKVAVALDFGVALDCGTSSVGVAPAGAKPGDSVISSPLLANRRPLCLHRANRGATSSVSLEGGLDCLHLPSEPDDLRLLCPDLFLLFADQRLLFFCGLDQQCGEPAVIDAPGVLAIRLQVVGDAAELFDFSERAVQRVDVGLPAARAECCPAIAQRMACALRDG